MVWIASRTSPAIPLAATGLLAAGLAAWEYSAQRNVEALWYPVINVTLVSAFLVGLVGNLAAGRTGRCGE